MGERGSGGREERRAAGWGETSVRARPRRFRSFSNSPHLPYFPHSPSAIPDPCAPTSRTSPTPPSPPPNRQSTIVNRQSTRTPPACRRTCAGRTARCTSDVRGRSGSTPASPQPRNRTRSTAGRWGRGRGGSRSPSTSPPTAATTPTMCAWRATWGRPASPSTPSRT